MVDGIYGASTDNSRLDKDQVIRWAFEHIGFDEAAGDRALMVAIAGPMPMGPRRAVWIAWDADGAMLSQASSRSMAHTKSSIP